jgi:hypothetical protein
LGIIAIRVTHQRAGEMVILAKAPKSVERSFDDLYRVSFLMVLFGLYLNRAK